MNGDSHQPCIRLQTVVDSCTVLTADAVATGEVNFYNFIFRLRSRPWFAETISQRYCRARFGRTGGTRGDKVTTGTAVSGEVLRWPRESSHSDWCQ